MSKDKNPIFESGSKFHYSGSGYILLGMLIEEVTDKKYDQYIQEIIFDKLNLEDTHFIDNEVVETGVADGYEAEYDDEGNSRALRSNQLLNEEHTKLILEPKVLDQDSDGFRAYTWPCFEIILSMHLIKYSLSK